MDVPQLKLPDSLAGFGDLLPVLDTGEALVVGRCQPTADEDPSLYAGA